jgi:hypothetical protein
LDCLDNNLIIHHQTALDVTAVIAVDGIVASSEEAA